MPLLNTILRARATVALVAPIWLVSLPGCGDDSIQDGNGGAETDTCERTCRELYACGSADDGALCPTFIPGQVGETSFLEGENDDGCVAGCRRDPSLVDLVNPADCAATIARLSGNDEFDAACNGR